MFAAWEKGFDEFKKSEYYAERAEAARHTAQERSLQIRDLLIGGLRKQKRQSEHRKRIWNHIAKC
ncbi:MAG: hypothetical protein ACLSAZ_09890 [Blautia wexlerae]